MNPAPIMSMLSLNRTHPAARRDIVKRDRMHKTLCIIVGASRSAGNILWRYEHDHSNGPAVLLQSTVTPDPQTILAGYGTLEGAHDMAPHLARLAAGQSVRYRLIANPVVNVARSNRRRPVSRSMIPDWWRTHARTVGLSPNLDALRVSSSSEPHPKNSKAILFCARLDGIATIDDADHLREAILTGIGPSKPYGCGLLTVSKPL